MLIGYPEKKDKSEIVAVLWYFLRKEKVDARLQVAVGRKKLDIVCFKDRRAMCIIECRSWSPLYGLVYKYRTSNRRKLEELRQLFGIPVFVCGRSNDITKVEDEVLALFDRQKKYRESEL